MVTRPTSVSSTYARTSSRSRSMIVTKVGADGRGTFTSRGAVVDDGRAVVRRAVVNGRWNATEILSGTNGTIVVTSQPLAAK